MSIKIPKSGGDFKLPPADTHVGRCISVIDLGTQEVLWEGKTKHLRKIRISWELPNEKEVFNEEKGEQPFMVSKDYTLSMSDKANLRKDLESWRGKPFTDAECDVFDEQKLLGVPCMLTIIHNSKGDKTYANIANVTKLLKGITCPEQINASMSYNSESGATTMYKALPDWLQAKIAKSPEFQAASGNHHDGKDDDIDLDKIISKDEPDMPF